MTFTLVDEFARLQSMYNIPDPTAGGNAGNGGYGGGSDASGATFNFEDATGLAGPLDQVIHSEYGTFIIYSDGHIMKVTEWGSSIGCTWLSVLGLPEASPIIIRPAPDEQIDWHARELTNIFTNETTRNVYLNADRPALIIEYDLLPNGELGNPRIIPEIPPAQDADPQHVIKQYLYTNLGNNQAVFLETGVGTLNDDTLQGSGVLIGMAGNDTLIGGSGNDTLSGGEGNDSLIGGVGNNILYGGGGADQLDGTGGSSVADYHTAQTAVTVNLDGSGNIGDEAAGDSYINVNGVQGSIYGDTLNGNTNANRMMGGGGNDTVNGWGGNDTLYSSDGDDSLSGGAGDDVLVGGDGTDALVGGDGADSFVGGAGNDWLDGGAGADALDGGDGWDVVSYLAMPAANGVIIDMTTNANGGAAAGDVLTGVEVVQGTNANDTMIGLDRGNGNGVELHGEGGNDSLIGKAGGDRLYGGDGDDLLIGGAGADHLIGGIGNNVLEGGDGADTLDGTGGWGVADYRNAHTAVTVRLDGSGNAGDEAAGDVYININGAFGSAYGDTINGNANANWIIACGGNDTVLGGVGNDTLYGSDGDDNLNGGSDNDLLLGGAGKDVLTGGAGNDVFVFDTSLNMSTNVDRILDFNVAQDKIQLDHGIFTAFGSSVSLAIGSMANNGGAQIIYNSGTGDLSYDADGLGGGLAIKFAVLSTGLALTAGNFIL